MTNRDDDAQEWLRSCLRTSSTPARLLMRLHGMCGEAMWVPGRPPGDHPGIALPARDAAQHRDRRFPDPIHSPPTIAGVSYLVRQRRIVSRYAGARTATGAKM